MLLEDWIIEKGLSYKTASRELKIPYTVLWNICNGKSNPSLKMVLDIEIATKGKVKLKDFLQQVKGK